MAVGQRPGAPKKSPPAFRLVLLDESGLGLVGRRGFRRAVLKMAAHLMADDKKSLSEVRVAFLKPPAMRRLKKEFFGKDRDTDVLSFPDESGGDLAVCPRVVWADAARDKRDSGQYLAEVILHGFLHLLGLRHDYQLKNLKALWARQAKLLLASGVQPEVFRKTEKLKVEIKQGAGKPRAVSPRQSLP